MENVRPLSCKRQLPSVLRPATSPFLINTLTIAVLKVQLLTDRIHLLITFFTDYMWIVYMNGQSRFFISTIGYLKMLLIMKRHVASLSSS